MAIADELRSFLETRLQALDPTIDLSSSSPAQIQVIGPALRRFAEDPFATDIPTFIKDRLTQEFPELAVDGGGLVEDILSKPFQLMLEPFKREIELVKLGQSTNNAALMSEDEADALGANWFEGRDDGNTSSGGVRLYFAAPTNARVTTEKRLFTASGLSFFPTQNYFLSAQQMLFNRQGSQYFLDIVVRAEQPGNQYNVRRLEIVGIEDVPNIVRVANLSDFIDGAPRESNEEYLGRFDQTLTERSLVTKRGVLARTPSLFSSVRALQIVGAGDEGMNRDILTGTGEGFLHMAGQATVYGDWLWAHTVVYKDDGVDDNTIPQAGDKIRFHQGVPSSTTPTVVEATISTVLAGAAEKYLFLLDSSPFSAGSIIEGRFALFKPGYLTISNVPGGISAAITVPDNTVHLGGHTDIFVRPTEDAEVLGVLQNVTDDSPLVAIVDLTVVTALDNVVRAVSAASGFADKGVQIGDVIVIETGVGFAGTYRILQVDDPVLGDLRVDTIFSAATSPGAVLRARIVRSINVDVVSPKIPKLPFDTGSVSDLQTTVGSTEFKFVSTDIQAYGARVGDVINLLDGPDAGEYVIQDFPPLLGGQGAIVDRAVSATAAGLRYEVYTKFDGLTLPLVRLKSLEVLDSTNQGTGITIPYGDAVDIRPTCDFEGAGEEKKTLDDKLFVFPDLKDIWPLPADPVSVITSSTDARFTQRIELADGVVRKFSPDGGNSITEFEINLPPFLWNGRRDTLMAFVNKKDPDFPSSAAGNHFTSDLANAKIGDTVTLLAGPNQGQYIIKDHRVLNLWGKTVGTLGHQKVALIQVDPELKVDPVRTSLDFMLDAGVTEITPGGAGLAEELLGFIDWATDFDNASAFYKTFTDTLFNTLGSEGVSFATANDLRSFLSPLVRTGYSVGPAAKGDLRLYFQDPTSVEFYFGDDPTTFVSVVGTEKKFRISPDLPAAQILPESETATPPTQWNRNLGVRLSQDDRTFLTSGLPFAKRGILPGDSIEFHRAINDLPARNNMSSSWLATTSTGSNVVQLILPASDPTWEQGSGGVDNYTAIEPGMLLFIDSGPDMAPYTITKVVEQTWSTNPAVPPVIKVQVDKALTHTTEDYPNIPLEIDHTFFLPAFVKTTGNVFPMNLSGKKIKFSQSTNRGTSVAATYEYTFSGPDPYNSITDVVSELLLDAGFTVLFTPQADGDELAVTSVAGGARGAITVDSPSSSSAYGDLQFTVFETGLAIAGGAAVVGTKRLYSSGFTGWSIGDWITIYAANGAALLGNGNDDEVLGTYEVTAVGTSGQVGWAPHNHWIDIERTENFPNQCDIRWVKVPEPDETPLSTDDGGTEISTQFVRVRLYESVPEERTVVAIPWTDPDHPLLETSEYQVQLDDEIIDTTQGQRNYAHKMPFRVLRDGVLRVSSTTMATNREGALYYVDVPVVGYGPGDEMNIGPSEGFLLAGRSKIDGYTLTVADENFSFSSREQLAITLPNSILPIGSTPDEANRFSLAGQNIQVTYNNAPLVDDLQRFFDSPLDRVTAANLLVRHFLPAYVFLDVNYEGGLGATDVAKELISYINNIDPDVNELRTDLLQDLIKRLGATKVDLPLTIITLIHGADRRVRGMRSTKSLGVGDLPFFKGTFNQAYFISGPDTSASDPRPNGEQIFLIRR